MSKNKSKIVKWEYVTKPFDVLVVPATVKRVHAQILYDELEKMREAGELTEEEIKSGVYEEGVVDCINWQWYVDRHTTTQMRYEYPVSIDLGHPLTRDELNKYY